MGVEDSPLESRQLIAVSTFAWFMMAVFGMVVVLLLLNMLIARFAKTFDMVHEDLAGTFKVAFARVAIKGAGLQAIPPPFNLVRGMVLVIYGAIGKINCACGGFVSLRRPFHMLSMETQEDGSLEAGSAENEAENGAENSRRSFGPLSEHVEAMPEVGPRPPCPRACARRGSWVVLRTRNP